MSFCLNCDISFPKGKNTLGKYCSNRCQKIHQRPAFEDIKTDRTRRIRLIEETGHICWSCKLETWLDKPLPLELDHVDGNHKNNSRENLRVLCPNCHALTPTFKAKNRGNGRAYRNHKREE